MMDVQLPHIAAADASKTTSTQSAPRPGQGGGRRESSGSGKSFSSELREAHTTKEPRHEIGRSQTESDVHEASMSSDESSSTSTTSTSSSTTRDGQAGDGTVESSRLDPDTATASPLPDVTTQSVLLALGAQLIVKPDVPAMVPTSSGELTNTIMESVMPSVMEDGTSLPVTAADSSIFQQTGHNENTAELREPTAAIQSDAPLLSAVNPNRQPIVSPDEDGPLNSQAQPTPEELRNIQQEKQTVPLTREDDTHVSETVEVKPEPVVLSHDLSAQVRENLTAVNALTAEQVQRPEDNRPIVTERPIHTQDTPMPKEEAASREPSVVQPAWQEPLNQDDEGGREWPGRDQRERPSADPASVPSAVPEVSTPTTPSHAAVAANGLDHRAFSSAPSAKVPVETHNPAPTPSVQPTDWMPGSSASQTKSMVLELSQTDLGRVNIRVAVNQDTVHTYFSSERNELGQYLVNGQDRLQSALNASGLDLGRFQVDIDRQSAGRSFQQPTSQGQSNNHSRQDASQTQGQGREEFTQDSMPRRGMLNLVA